MGDDDSGAPEAAEGFRHLLLGDVVESAGGLVKHDDLRFGRDGSGDHQPLLLSAGNAAAALRNDGMHVHRHPLNVLCDSRHPCRLPGVFKTQPWSRNHDVGIDVSRKEGAVLHDDTDIAADRFHIQGVEVFSVKIDRSRLRLFKTQQNPHQRGLAAAGFADDGHILVGPDLQGQVVDDLRPIRRILEGDVAQLNGTVQPGHCLFVLLHLGHGLHDRFHHLHGRLDVGDHVSNAGQAHDGRAYQAIGRGEGHVVSRRNPCHRRDIVEHQQVAEGEDHRKYRRQPDDYRRVVLQIRTGFVGFRPAPEHSFLRS